MIRLLLGLLCLLLRNLFKLNGLCEFSAKCQVGNGDIVQNQTELLGPFRQSFVNPGRHEFTICNEFSGVKLSDNCLKDFICDGRENTIVIVLAESCVNA